MFLKTVKFSIGTLMCALLFTTGAGAELSIEPSFGLQEAYDSNPELLASTVGGSGTFKSTLTPSVSVTGAGKSYSLTGNYTLTSLFHHNNKALDYNIHTAAVTGSVKAGKRSTITFKDNYTLNTGVPITGPGVGIHLSRSPIGYNTVSTGLSTRFGKFWTFALNLSDSRTEYDDPVLIDTVTDTASLSLDYMLSRKSTINSSYTFTTFSFDTAGNGTSSEIHNLSLGVTRLFSSTLTGVLSGGVLYSSGFNNNLDWTLNTSLSKKTGQYNASLTLSRSMKDSSGLVNEVTLYDTLLFSANYSLKSNLTLNASSTLARIRSEPARTVDLTTLNSLAGATWRLNNSLSLSMNFSRYNQWVDSSTAVSLVRDQVYLGITYKPSKWRL